MDGVATPDSPLAEDHRSRASLVVDDDNRRSRLCVSKNLPLRASVPRRGGSGRPSGRGAAIRQRTRTDRPRDRADGSTSRVDAGSGGGEISPTAADCRSRSRKRRAGAVRRRRPGDESGRPRRRARFSPSKSGSRGRCRSTVSSAGARARRAAATLLSDWSRHWPAHGKIGSDFSAAPGLTRPNLRGIFGAAARSPRDRS